MSRWAMLVVGARRIGPGPLTWPRPPTGRCPIAAIQPADVM